MSEADPIPETFFAPAGRAAAGDLQAQMVALVNDPLVVAILESLDGFVLVLNTERQILAANEELLEALRQEGLEDPLGHRWGEAYRCVHAQEGPDGCGTSRACSCCGAVLGALAAMKDQVPVTGECHMSLRRQGKWEAREFHVKATPFTTEAGELLIQVFHDVSDHHRREVLESTFLHDLSNTLTALSGWSELMSHGVKDQAQAATRIVGIAAQLSDAVNHQRLLARAEKGDLPVSSRQVEVVPFLAGLQGTLASNPLTEAKELTLALEARAGEALATDPTLVHRILCNMGVNALEASPRGATITLGFRRGGEGHRFFVHNPGVIPDRVALQIFQRSFSTKAKAGRGLGTYAMRIFGENALGGKVDFTSTPEGGTEFYLLLP